MVVAALSKFIKKEYPAALTLYGGMRKQPEFIEAFAEKTREFLQPRKGKYISIQEITDYYHSIFPQLRLKVKDKSAEVLDSMSKKSSSTNGVKAVSSPKSDEMLCLASAQTNYSPTQRCVKSFTLELSSVRFSDYVKKFFGIKNKNEGKFFVNSEFVETFIHEGIHIMQICVKPTCAEYIAKLRRIANGNKFKSQLMENAVDDIYFEQAYCPNLLPIKPKKFVGMLLDALKQPICGVKVVRFKDAKGNFSPIELNGIDLIEDGKIIPDEKIKGIKKLIKKHCPPIEVTPKLLLAQLKIILRSLQEEKQAFDVGRKYALIFDYPRLGRSERMKKAFDIFAKLSTSFNYKFDSKIEALKEAYLELLNSQKLKP